MGLGGKQRTPVLMCFLLFTVSFLGAVNIGAATTYTFPTVGTIVSMTPAAASSYVFTGTHGGTLSLKNTLVG